MKDFAKELVDQGLLDKTNLLSTLIICRPRDEAASATIGNTTYVVGGIGERSMEFINMENLDSFTTEVIR